jgi:hypothetical protein
MHHHKQHLTTTTPRVGPEFLKAVCNFKSSLLIKNKYIFF